MAVEHAFRLLEVLSQETTRTISLSMDLNVLTLYSLGEEEYSTMAMCSLNIGKHMYPRHNSASQNVQLKVCAVICAYLVLLILYYTFQFAVHGKFSTDEKVDCKSYRLSQNFS